MFNLTSGKDRLVIETGGTLFEWSSSRGGQLIRCDLKGYHGNHPLMTPGDAAPNLIFDLVGKVINLADIPMELSVEEEDSEHAVFKYHGQIDDLFTLDQRYEVFREGVVFCEFGLWLHEGKQVIVRKAEMGFNLDVLAAPNLRQNCITRDPYLKQDVTCIHVLSTMKVSADRDETLEIPHLVPLYGLDLGWEESRYFSNRVEMVLEDDTSIGSGMLGVTRTKACQEDGRMKLTWTLCDGAEEVLTAPFLYRNKWGLFCGAARTEAGTKADPAHRNNVLGSRVCHVMYPYVRKGEGWPWTSIPIRQVFYQDAQLAKENPPLERIDEAVNAGANVLIIHQFWMNNGGSNGEPCADYKVHDPEWFKAFVDYAHQCGMRVAVYMRGIEHYSLYMDFFEKYLTKDLDGLYVDWATPFGLGYSKASSKHCSIYNWFTFSRALRKRVGEQGFLIGHSAIQTYVSYACFDVALTGEFSVMHSGLLASPEISTSYSGLGMTGVHLLAGNAPDRAVFSSQYAAGMSAGLGYGNHPFMEPGIDYMECSAFIRPLWEMFKAMGCTPVRVFNPAVGTEKVVRWNHDALHPVIYQGEDRTTLIIIANLSEEKINGEVELDFEALGLSPKAKMKSLVSEQTHTAKVDGCKVILEEMVAYQFCGLLIQRSES